MQWGWGDEIEAPTVVFSGEGSWVLVNNFRSSQIRNQSENPVFESCTGTPMSEAN